MENTDCTPHGENENVPSFPQKTVSNSPAGTEKDEISDVDDEMGAGGDHPQTDDDLVNRWDPVKKSILEKEAERKRDEEQA